MSENNYSDVLSSYGRCLLKRGFIERFYDIFMASDDSIRALFARTDMSKQYLALRRGISTAISYAEGSGIVGGTMDEMAQVHSRKGRVPIQPHLYRHWLESILKAVREYDPAANARLMQRWEQALTPAVNRFIDMY